MKTEAALLVQMFERGELADCGVKGVTLTTINELSRLPRNRGCWKALT